MEAVTCDVLVIGSGAAGLTTAITAHHFGADVLVVEKAATFGGTTARSGGWLWVPGNPLASRAGVDDPLEAAKTYIKHAAGNHFDEARVNALLDNAERTIEEVNRDAGEGHDRAFNRGATSYQRLLGDEAFVPNPCIGEISAAPFYAVKIIPGDIATYHGLVTDERTRVMDIDRKPIPGPVRRQQ
jgi:succinate dehydrogenase/fumarate reductase flavoprotein subunit